MWSQDAEYTTGSPEVVSQPQSQQQMQGLTLDNPNLPQTGVFPVGNCNGPSPPGNCGGYRPPPTWTPRPPIWTPRPPYWGK